VTGRKLPLLIAVLLFCFGAASVSAQRSTTQTPAGQNTPQSTAQKDATQVSPETADLAITATVTARELRFEVVPNPTVEFTGKPERDTVWDAERENLPRPLQPGVTYRNIGIRLKIVSRFADIERIVAEALGEIPATDKIPAKENSAPQQNTQPPASTSQPNGGPPR
jgi:hypothetical protein